MAQHVLLFLILTHTFLTMSATSLKVVKSSTVVQPPAFSPLNNIHIIHKAEAPTSSRRMGKHHHHVIKSSESPASEPSRDHDEENGASGTSSIGEESGMYLEKHQHHNHHESGSVNKSMAGGGVILGGLVMAFVVSIVCYIRATRRKSLVEPPTPTTARSSPSP